MYVTFEEKAPMKPMIGMLIAAMMTLAGCNTVQGMGQDIQKAGSAIERAGSK
jgi:predicted small secreted protein